MMKPLGAPESGHKLGLVLLQQQMPLQERILSLPKVPQHCLHQKQLADFR